LLKFRFGETSGGRGAHISLRGDRERKLCDHLPVRRLGNDQNVVFAGGDIDILDFAAQVLERGAGRFQPVGRILDVLDSLVGPLYLTGYNVVMSRFPMINRAAIR
jgi:hypothetical protein